MTLSIITPCYNGAEFVEAAIQSVLRQDTEDVELLLINDGSTDETDEICQPYIGVHPGHPSVRYYKTPNKGAGHARNYGIDRANGQWIAFLDADDLYLDQAFNNRFFTKLSKYFTEKVDVIQTAKLKTDLMLSQEVGILMPEQLEDVQNHIPMLEFWTCIYRHDFLTLNGIRFYEYRQQDVETAFRYLAYSYAGNICIDTFMNFYLQRDNLQSNTHTWNTYHLHQIKSSIYYDLYKRTPCKGDCAFLYRIIVEQLAAYYKLCHEYGYDSKSGFETMHKLFSNIKKLPSTLQTPELSAQLKQIGRWDLKTRIFGPKLRTSSDTPQKKHVENPAIPLDVLFQRLTDLSPALLRIK